MNKELVFLRSLAVAIALGVCVTFATAFKNQSNQRFGEIDVERINIIEKDGTIKMIITNVESFPTGKETINGRPTNEGRKKRSGMLFFNEDGIECGGFIYDGTKNSNGHSAGLSLTYDQYDGDQVMQLIVQDEKVGDNRFVSSGLMFNDRPSRESQIRTGEIMKELNVLRKNDPKLAQEKYEMYAEEGLIGGAPRVMLGKSRSESNGLFLFDDKGVPRSMFYIDKENNAKLDFYDDQGNVIASFPDN
ncbi:MAG: hypothetical protein LAT68_06400 [Cyclobacteriaceae bacterium]|nr:hypothetical protein [Cyclobacteriaceae bacterium]MCH8515941.1 hypothetical protein [Cyclobacteriaceae bacterium]